MFKQLHAGGKLIARAYNLPEVRDFQLTLDNLWDDREEYHYYFPQSILLILNQHKEIHIAKLKEILDEHNIPTDLGYLLQAISALVKNDTVSYCNRIVSLL